MTSSPRATSSRATGSVGFTCPDAGRGRILALAIHVPPYLHASPAVSLATLRVLKGLSPIDFHEPPIHTRKGPMPQRNSPVAVRRHPPAATEGKLPASMPEDSMIDWDQKR